MGPIPGGGVLACALEGEAVRDEATGATEAEALAGLGQAPGRRVRIGHGTPGQLPAPVLPEAGPDLPALEQARPRDEIGGWLRVRVAGVLAGRRNRDGVICAAEADVSHWLHVSAGEIVSSRSFLTRRLATALGGAESADPDAVTESLSRPEHLAAHLRSAALEGAAAAITGHLIGAELAATRPYWLGQDVIIIHPAGAAAGLVTALGWQGVPAVTHRPGDLLAPGLAALGRAFGLT